MLGTHVGPLHLARRWYLLPVKFLPLFHTNSTLSVKDRISPVNSGLLDLIQCGLTQLKDLKTNSHQGGVIEI